METPLNFIHKEFFFWSNICQTLGPYARLCIGCKIQFQQRAHQFSKKLIIYYVTTLGAGCGVDLDAPLKPQLSQQGFRCDPILGASQLKVTQEVGSDLGSRVTGHDPGRCISFPGCSLLPLLPGHHDLSSFPVPDSSTIWCMSLRLQSLEFNLKQGK